MDANAMMHTDRTTAPGYAPKTDKNGETLVPGMSVRWCVPASNWKGAVRTGKVVKCPALPTRVGDDWLATLAVRPDDEPEGPLWLLPSSAMELVVYDVTKVVGT